MIPLLQFLQIWFIVFVDNVIDHGREPHFSHIVEQGNSSFTFKPEFLVLNNLPVFVVFLQCLVIIIVISLKEHEKSCFTERRWIWQVIASMGKLFAERVRIFNFFWLIYEVRNSDSIVALFFFRLYSMKNPVKTFKLR